MKKELFWVFIPARSGSKSIKNKNIKLLNGKPILAYSIIVAKKLKFVSKIVVSSDSKNYLKIAKKYGSNFLHLRSKKLSGDKTTDFEVFSNFINHLKKLKIKPPKYFIHLRPTTPLRNKSIINKAVNFFLKNSNKCSSMRSVSLMSNPSFKTMRILKKRLCSVINNDFQLDKYNKPKEFFPKTYLPNGYIDIVKSSNIIKKKLHGSNVLPYIIKEFNSDIDSIKDYNYVKYKTKKK
jgi:CMP-N-acetylneuraminic acid synthetase